MNETKTEYHPPNRGPTMNLRLRLEAELQVPLEAGNAETVAKALETAASFIRANGTLATEIDVLHGRLGYGIEHAV